MSVRTGLSTVPERSLLGAAIFGCLYQLWSSALFLKNVKFNEYIIDGSNIGSARFNLIWVLPTYACQFLRDINKHI